MSSSENYDLKDLENMSKSEIRDIAKKKCINARQNIQDLKKQITNKMPRKYTKKKTQKKKQVAPMHIKNKKYSSRSSSSSQSSSSKQETPSKSNSQERAYLNKDSVRGVISSIIINNKEYRFLSKIDFDYGEISKLLHINYKDEWRINLQKVKNYLETNNISLIAKNLEYLNSDIQKLSTIVNQRNEINNIYDFCDSITQSIDRVNNFIKTQQNKFIKINEEYKKDVNNNVDKFNKKKHVKDNNFTIPIKLK
jgi:hypothetical protein